MAPCLPCQSPRGMAIFAICHLPIMPRDRITPSDEERPMSRKAASEVSLTPPGR